MYFNKRKTQNIQKSNLILEQRYLKEQAAPPPAPPAPPAAPAPAAAPADSPTTPSSSSTRTPIKPMVKASGPKSIKGKDGKVIVATRKQIFDYISVPVAEDNGVVYTQAQLDDINRTNNKHELVLRYINNLLGNDISQLTKSAISRNNVLKIKAGTGDQRKIVIKSNVATGKVKVNTPLK